MPPVKTEYVPRFGSRQGPSERSEAQPGRREMADRAPTPSHRQGGKRGKRRGNGRPEKNILKVKLPKFNSRTLLEKASKDDERPTVWILEPSPNKTKTTVNQRCGSDADSDPAPADRDVFFFSQRSDIKAADEKEKVKISVLRTISKILEENQLIRQRLAALRQAS